MEKFQPLPASVRKDDLEGLIRMLESGQFTQTDLDMALAHAVWYQVPGPHGFRREMAERLIRRGADPNGRYGDYGPIVFGTGECLNVGGLKYLIEAGADVTFAPVQTKYGQTCPLSSVLGGYARTQNDYKHRMIDLLLQHGAFVPPQVSPPILAIHRGDAKQLASLLDADPSLINRRYADMPYGNIELAGASLLHCAVELCEIECVDVLIDRGADANLPSLLIDEVGGQTPLFHALQGHWEEQYRTLAHLLTRTKLSIDASIKASFRRFGVVHAPVSALEFAMEAGDPKWRRYADAERELVSSHEIRRAEAMAQLVSAVRAGDLESVQRLVDQGVNVNKADERGNPPLFVACGCPADAPNRMAIVELLAREGAQVRRACENQSTALHAAASQGPVELVEFLIRHGAKDWQADRNGKVALDDARAGAGVDKEKIVELLNRPVIRDPAFKAAVRAIHGGDIESLRRLLKDHPNLIRDRAVEPDCYPRSDYFRDPKLLWFVANNPTLIKSLPANIVDMAAVIIDAGAGQEDLDYTLGLVMTGSAARGQGLQIPLMKLLVDRGARPGDLSSTLGHGELEPVRFLLAHGHRLNPAIASSLGMTEELSNLLKCADSGEVQAALGLAVINRQLASARLCLEAGADPNRFLPVHKHSTPAHQAAINNDMPMMQLLMDHGARLDIRDTLWNATPLGWALHGGGAESPMAIFLKSVKK